MGLRRSGTAGVFLILGIAAGCGSEGEGGADGVGRSVSASHAWDGYHWARTSNPFELPLGDNMTTEWDGFLSSVSSDWSTSAVLDTAIIAGTSSPRCTKGVNGTVQVCNGSYGFNGWLGLARIRAKRDGHIVWGIAKVNDSYFDLNPYNDSNAKRHVLCQEVGHTLGLDHQRDDDPATCGGVGGDCKSCMNDTAGLTDPGYVSPNAHDYDQLASIYSHLDSFSTVGSVMVVAADSGGAGPGAPGAQGRGVPHEDLYVTDLPGGDQLATWVLWAE